MILSRSEVIPMEQTYSNSFLIILLRKEGLMIREYKLVLNLDLHKQGLKETWVLISLQLLIQ